MLTGETGAGKSIVVGALSLVLGGRANAELVRPGAEEAEVEALFDVRGSDRLIAQLDAAGVAHGGELAIRRVVQQGGRSRAYVNGRLCTAGELAALAPELADVASQHESVALTDPATHLDYLDRFARLVAQRGELAAEVARLEEVVARDPRRARGRARARRARGVPRVPAPGDRRDRAAGRRARGARRGARPAAPRGAALRGDAPRGLAARPGRGRPLRRAGPLRVGAARRGRARPCPRGAGLGARRLLGRPLRRGPRDRPLRRARPGRPRSARRGRGAPVPARGAAPPARAEPRRRARRARADRRRARVARGRSRAAWPIWSASATTLLARRRRAGAHALGEAARRPPRSSGAAISGELVRARAWAARAWSSTWRRSAARRAELAVDGARLGHDGIDRVEFLISPNKGIDPRPLRRIASGGELSRALLALKRSLAECGPAGLYVFDEVDTGVGGAVAEKHRPRHRRRRAAPPGALHHAPRADRGLRATRTSS